MSCHHAYRRASLAVTYLYVLSSCVSACQSRSHVPVCPVIMRIGVPVSQSRTCMSCHHAYRRASLAVTYLYVLSSCVSACQSRSHVPVCPVIMRIGVPVSQSRTCVSRHHAYRRASLAPVCPVIMRIGVPVSQSRTCVPRHHAYRRASLAVRHADLTVARPATDEYRRPRRGVLHEHEVSHGAIVEQELRVRAYKCEYV